ncbi:serine/threonine-protein phosphatase 2A activator-like [Diaphorina citri]|uniref:Serine/threonine-protein phosphatase 2A activator n=1 Tax=Diaphorina citri TaxID=121845 RepID=A0A3Q0JF92_DIACI|nr:serine/threonine-protein phosphatase 2A activator-like [Diaphorina citri]
MNEAVRGKAIDTRLEPSNNVMSVFQMLEHFNKLIDETPPIDQPQRFGNKAFAQWLNKIGECVETELQKALPEKFHAAIPEISVYLKESFGNSTRIDYGTGHEMAFCMFLLCLFRIGAFSMNDRVAVVNRIFVRYLDLVRRLQCEYRMEPAGSHGVWSLDDYQFVPFIWGSSQLFAFSSKNAVGPDHVYAIPKRQVLKDSDMKQWENSEAYHNSYHSKAKKSFFCIHFIALYYEPEIRPTTIQNHEREYSSMEVGRIDLFLACIQYIMKVKTGHFSEHSNQLWNISALPSWSKINQGLLKMYKGEVLAKFPVIQHVLFGSLIKFEPLQHDIRTPVMTARPLPPKFTSEFTKPLCDGDVTSANTSSQS